MLSASSLVHRHVRCHDNRMTGRQDALNDHDDLHDLNDLDELDDLNDLNDLNDHNDHNDLNDLDDLDDLDYLMTGSFADIWPYSTYIFSL